MKNYISKGKVITIAAAEILTAGVPVVIGELVGIPVCNATVGEHVAVDLCGVYECDKAAGAIAQGAKLYWDDAANNVTTTASTNKVIGHAWDAALNADTKVTVKLLW